MKALELWWQCSFCSSRNFLTWKPVNADVPPQFQNPGYPTERDWKRVCANEETRWALDRPSKIISISQGSLLSKAWIKFHCITKPRHMKWMTSKRNNPYQVRDRQQGVISWYIFIDLKWVIKLSCNLTRNIKCWTFVIATSSLPNS